MWKNIVIILVLNIISSNCVSENFTKGTRLIILKFEVTHFPTDLNENLLQKGTVQNVQSERPIVSLFNTIRERIRNRFSPKGNNTISTTVSSTSTVSTNPTTTTQEESTSTTTVKPQQPLEVASENLESAPLSTFPIKAAEVLINSEFDENDSPVSLNLVEPITETSTTTPPTTATPPPPCKCEELNIQILDFVTKIINGMRMNTENISRLNNALVKFKGDLEERLNEISEVLKSLNDQVAVNNEISQYCYSNKDLNGKKKTGPATQSNIIKLDIIKP